MPASAAAGGGAAFLSRPHLLPLLLLAVLLLLLLLVLLGSAATSASGKSAGVMPLLQQPRQQDTPHGQVMTQAAAAKQAAKHCTGWHAEYMPAAIGGQACRQLHTHSTNSRPQ